MRVVVDGVDRVVRSLQDLFRKHHEPGKSVVVGFTANYALHVHENLEMAGAGLPRRSGHGLYWDPQGIAGPKFLENPARELSNSGELSRILTSVVKGGKSVMQGLLACGLRIQREAQQRVPVDTGNLKASAFTRIE